MLFKACDRRSHGLLFVVGLPLLVLGACTQDDSFLPFTGSDNAVSSAQTAAGKLDAATVSTLDASLPSLLDASTVVVREAGAALDDDTLLTLAAQLISLCPLAAPSDAAARERCADGLTGFDAFRDLIADPILWGGQPAGLALGQVPEQASLTNLNPRVWRRLTSRR